MAITRVTWQATAVVNSAGLNTYTFQAVSQGFVANVTVSVPGAAAGVLWSVYVSGSLVGSVDGSSLFGPVYLSGGDVLSVSGTPPAETASGPAVAVGSMGLPSEMLPGSPSAGGGIGPTITLLGTIPAGNLTATVSPTPTALQLIIQPAQQVNGFGPTVTGVQSGLILSASDALNFTRIGGTGYTAFVAPLPVGPDSEYTVELVGTQTTSCGIYQTTTPVFFPTGLPVDPLTYAVEVELVTPTVTTSTLATPPVGTDWSVTLNVSWRLVAITATFVTSATVANRYPMLLFDGHLYCPMGSAVQTAGQGITYNGFTSAGAVNAGFSASGAVSFPIPDMMLATGSTIASHTASIQAGDQWSSITFFLSSN